MEDTNAAILQERKRTQALDEATTKDFRAMRKETDTLVTMKKSEIERGYRHHLDTDEFFESIASSTVVYQRF